MSRFIEPMPLRDATVFFAIWRREPFLFEVTISYAVRGQVGTDSRAWPFRSLSQAREALPPGLVMLSPDPDEDSPELVEVWT